MFSTEHFRVWFRGFSGEHHRLRAARIKAELNARHTNGPEEYLSDKPTPRPRPRFDVRVTDDIGRRRPHRRTNQRPPGRPSQGQDVYFGPKVVDAIRNEGLTETKAIARVVDTLGPFDGWDDPENPAYDTQRAARNSARDRVYRSLKRYRKYLLADKHIAWLNDANAGWSITPEGAGRRVHDVIKAKYTQQPLPPKGRFSP